MQRQVENFEIIWHPGSSRATFKFRSHEQARAFAIEFCKATRLLRMEDENNDFQVKITYPPINEARNAFPINHMAGWIYIEYMKDFFERRSTTFNLQVTGTGENNECYIETLIRSILTHGSSITPEQFCFQSPSESKTVKAVQSERFHRILALVQDRFQQPQVHLIVTAFSELRSWFPKSEYDQLVQEIENPSVDMKNCKMVIDWNPGQKGPTFKFATHLEARTFVLQFLNATHNYKEIKNPYELPNSKTRLLENGETIPENLMRGLMGIDQLNQFFTQRKTSFQFCAGRRHEDIDITIFLAAVIQHGPMIAGDQFTFKANWQAQTEEGRYAERLERILAIIENSQNNPQVAFEFRVVPEETYTIKPSHIVKVIAALEAVNQSSKKNRALDNVRDELNNKVLPALQPSTETLSSEQKAYQFKAALTMAELFGRFFNQHLVITLNDKEPDNAPNDAHTDCTQ